MMKKREAMAAEAKKKKPKEQIRLQHMQPSMMMDAFMDLKRLG